MNILSCCLLGLFSCLGDGVGAREILPSFEPARCAWFATHIVVADEGKLIDGKLTILRSLKGDLHPGDKIELPRLKRFAAAKEREICPWFRGKGAPVETVVGQRLLLYLKKTPTGWVGAGWGDELLVSFAWLEDEGPVARQQFINPGPLAPLRLQFSTQDLFRTTAQGMSDRHAVDAALGIEDSDFRAVALAQILLSCSDSNQHRVAELLLSNGGKKGLDLVVDLLKKDAHLKMHGLLLWRLQQSNPAYAAEIAAIMVEQELAFWRAQAFSSAPAPDQYTKTAPKDGLLARHYRRTHALLSHLAQARSPSHEKPLAQLLSFWDEHPDLDEWLRYTVGFKMAVTIRLVRRN